MVLIAGRGVAALTCAKCLVAAGIDVTVYGLRRRGGPTVLIGTQTLELLADLFHQAAIVDLGHPVRGREVLWGQAEPVRVTAPARSIPLETLTTCLETSLASAVTLAEAATKPDPRLFRWHIDATGRQASVARQIAGADSTSFGKRHILAASVTLYPGYTDWMHIENLTAGWLFLCPITPDRGVVQLMWPDCPRDPLAVLHAALEQSRHVAWSCDVASVENINTLPAAPRILTTLGSDRWLAAGETAFSLDPVCGDGIGAAIHSAMLASAVITSAADHEDLTALLRHYHLRHRRSFAMHLTHVYDYYQPLLSHTAWGLELEQTRRFIHSDAARRLRNMSDFPYRLQGLRLQRTEGDC
jgi:flavin-dependent dehydrogenase